MATAEALAQDKQARPSRRIVVSIPDPQAGGLPGIGQGREGLPDGGGQSRRPPAPVAAYTIVQRIPDPTWYYQGKVVRPGKANPLGSRWLGLSVSGYGIHGTNSPASIGHNVSHGCIRMNNRDVEQLFEMVTIGDAVELLAERTPESDQIFGPVVVTVIGPVPPAQVPTLAEVGAGGKTASATAGLGNAQW